MTKMENSKGTHRIFSGIQPTGGLHLGNYLGALRNWARLQYEYDSIFCIVDLHAITVPYEPAGMQQRILDAAAMNMACGLDPKTAVIFVQSHVTEHTELCWLLNTMTSVGRLSRMTQFKEKSRRLDKEHINAGLFNYPILQAADILLYKADLVPVGEDQKQHLELARDIAGKFNTEFGETFPLPAIALSSAPRVMSLQDPTSKMSKSVAGSAVGLADEPDAVRRAIMRAVTDVGPLASGRMGPGIANLFTLMKEFSDEEVYKHFRQQYRAGTLRYADLKKQLAEDTVAALTPIREKYHELISQPDKLRMVLNDGAERARRIAKETMKEVKAKMGLA